MRNGYSAYSTYQKIAERAQARYKGLRYDRNASAQIWADITLASIRLSLTEPRDYPEGR